MQFGDIIREWRGLRRFSQLQLAMRAELSARHLSFLESGRARPSRDMVLRLASALEMPKAIANQALGAAGFAAAFPSLPADAPDLAPVRAAIAMTLANHDPYPAIVLDRGWTLVGANAGATAMFARAGAAADSRLNLIRMLISVADTGFIENWAETAALTLARIRAEIAQFGPDAELAGLADDLARHPRLKSADVQGLNRAVAPTIFNIEGARVAMFSTIAQFGSVQDVVASELKVEMMFPVDAAARRYFEGAR
jgi:transcriptional regulator with XRE-family HTH domain